MSITFLGCLYASSIDEPDTGHDDVMMEYYNKQGVSVVVRIIVTQTSTIHWFMHERKYRHAGETGLFCLGVYDVPLRTMLTIIMQGSQLQR